MSLKEEFDRLGPWYTKFDVDGVSFGGAYDAMNDPRIELFEREFPHAANILELGSLEGGHTLALAKLPGVKKVTGIEVRPENLTRSRFVQSVMGVTNVEFLERNLETDEISDLGPFDAVFCTGLLYHLPEPWKLIERIAALGSDLFLWTHISGEIEGKKKKEGCRGRYYYEGGWRDPLSGASKRSFWLTLGSLLHVLNKNGYRRIEILELIDHERGPAVTLSARMGTSYPASDRENLN